MEEIVALTIRDSFKIPVKDAQIAIYSDDTLVTLVASLTTDSDGKATALLEPGTYYLVVTHAVIDFVNPQVITVTATPSEGANDHGELTGLLDDDHTQYYNNTRGDARYSLIDHDHDGVYHPLDSNLTSLSAITTVVSGSALFSGNVGSANAFWFYQLGLLMYPTAATLGAGGVAYTFADDSGTTLKQIKASSLVLSNTISELSTASVKLWVNGNTLTTGYIEMDEISAPAAPSANKVRLYTEDNGAGKTRLMAIFPSGASQQVAIEP